MRPIRLTTTEIHSLYRTQQTLTDYDHTIDNSTLSVKDVVAQLLAITTISNGQ